MIKENLFFSLPSYRNCTIFFNLKLKIYPSSCGLVLPLPSRLLLILFETRGPKFANNDTPKHLGLYHVVWSDGASAMFTVHPTTSNSVHLMVQNFYGFYFILFFLRESGFYFFEFAFIYLFRTATFIF